MKLGDTIPASDADCQNVGNLLIREFKDDSTILSLANPPNIDFSKAKLLLSSRDYTDPLNIQGINVCNTIPQANKLLRLSINEFSGGVAVFFEQYKLLKTGPTPSTPATGNSWDYSGTSCLLTNLSTNDGANFYPIKVNSIANFWRTRYVKCDDIDNPATYSFTTELSGTISGGFLVGTPGTTTHASVGSRSDTSGFLTATYSAVILQISSDGTNWPSDSPLVGSGHAPPRDTSATPVGDPC